MNILHICSDFPHTNLYRELVENLFKIGIKSEVFVFSKKRKLPYRKVEEYVLHRINHTKYDRMIFHLKHHKVLKDICNLYDFNNFDILHAHSLFSNGYIAYKLHLKFGLPYIVAVRNTDINVFFKYMIHLRVLGRKILKNAEKVIFISESYKKYALNKYLPPKELESIMQKSEVIPNGINKFWFENIYKKKNFFMNEELKVLCVADINKNKNQITLAKACEKIIFNGKKIKLTLIGSCLSPKTLDKFKKYSFIEYIDKIPKEELIYYYRNNDLFVLPSKKETFGLVYAEALSQGLPVIYTEKQGFDGFFPEGKIGYSVKSNSSEDIKTKIEMLIKGECFDFINNSNEILSKFNWKNIAKKYSNIYYNKGNNRYL